MFTKQEIFTHNLDEEKRKEKTIEQNVKFINKTFSPKSLDELIKEFKDKKDKKDKI